MPLKTRAQMPQIVAPYHLCVWIGNDSKGITRLRALLTRNLGWINADRHRSDILSHVSNTVLPSFHVLVAAYIHYLLCNGRAPKTVRCNPQEVHRAHAKAYRALTVGVRGPGV